MSKIVQAIYDFFNKNRLLATAILVLSIVVCLFFALRLNFSEDISEFLPSSDKQTDFLIKQQGLENKSIVMLSPKDTSSVDIDLLCEAAEVFVQYLDSVDATLNAKDDIMYKIDTDKMMEVSDFIVEHLPYYLTTEDYAAIDSAIKPENIEKNLESNKQLLGSFAGIVLKNQILNDPLHFSVPILKRLNSFSVGENYKLHNQYIFTADYKNLFIFITSQNSSSETANNKKLVKNIENSLDYTEKRFENQLSTSYFGASAVAVSNAQQIKKDSAISITIAVVIISILLLSFYRKIKIIALIFVPVFYGGLLSLATLSILKDSISAISIGAGSIILGIAINYALHYMTQHRNGASPRQILGNISSPLIIGSFTTVGAFLSLLFISAEPMKDFGIFAAAALIGALIFVVIFLPHILTKTIEKKSDENYRLINKIAEYRFDKKKVLLIILLIVTPVLFHFSKQIKFETDMNKINYMSEKQKQAFKTISKNSSLGKNTIFCVSQASTVDSAIMQYEKILPNLNQMLADEEITEINGIGNFIPSQQTQKEKLKQWEGFWKDRKDDLNKNLTIVGKKLGYKQSAFDGINNLISKSYSILPFDEFSVINNNLASNYIHKSAEQYSVVTILHTPPAKSNEVISQINKDENVFAVDNTSVVKSMVGNLSKDFDTVLYICGFIVFAFLTLSFGRFELSLIAFIPMLISWVWILGIMTLFNINFNIVNIILATFIFGLGDDYTIFMLDGMITGYARKDKLLNTYKTSVILSAVTMFVGIGSLIIAKHPAMFSLAQVTMVGMFSVVMMSFILTPFFYDLITKKKSGNRLTPITFNNLFTTSYSFVFFVFASLFITLYGYVLLGLFGKTDKNKLRFHVLLQKTCKLVAKIIPWVSYKVTNHSAEDFEKPAIIISNHQSHLDLMYIMMLSPKIIILTNKWVWNSPFYGKLIKFADYLPIYDGIENHVGDIEKLVAKGYSIMVFPEGTRSEDGTINRFKKGAFYLANKLNLDIVPIVMHGVGNALQKSELILNKSSVSINIYDRIDSQSELWDDNYSEMSKAVRRWYRNEYESISDEAETPSYFKHKIISNYIYKGSYLDYKTKRTLNKYNCFTDIIDLIPDEGKVLELNCGHGTFSLLNSLVKKQITHVGVDNDVNKINLAKNCISVPENLEYLCRNYNEINFSDYDFAVSINPDAQLAEYIIENCDIPFVIQTDYGTDIQTNNKDVWQMTVDDKITFTTNIKSEEWQ
ncbi:MAG: 1-acyl-sn-glycerol-3-phosphate acyltransferase [Bacteroidales bacterium]|jgi:1-acyl-sn-glycerol-3-phosphate acyltransferase